MEKRQIGSSRYSTAILYSKLQKKSKKNPLGGMHKPRGQQGAEGGGSKISKKCPRYRSKLVHIGGRGGQKSPKNCPSGLCMPPIVYVPNITTYLVSVRAVELP